MFANSDIPCQGRICRKDRRIHTGRRSGRRSSLSKKKKHECKAAFFENAMVA